MGNLLSFRFWFNASFLPLLPLWNVIFMATLILFASAGVVFLVLKIKAKSKRKLWSEIFDFTLANTVIGLILLFVYFEEVRFFSARVWFLLWFVEILAWAYKVFKYGKTFYQKR